MSQKPPNDTDKKAPGLFDLPDFWKEDDYTPQAQPETKGKKTHKQVLSRLQTKLKLKKETVAEVIPEPIPPGLALHIVSNGNFDYWNIVVRLIELHQLKGATFYGATWTMNDANVKSLLSLIDDGTIQHANILVGLYFLHREPVVAASLREGFEGRAQNFKAAENHAKVVLLSNGQDYLVFEGSANFTANPRIEQFVLNNNRELYEFHKTWLDGYLKQ